MISDSSLRGWGFCCFNVQNQVNLWSKCMWSDSRVNQSWETGSLVKVAKWAPYLKFGHTKGSNCKKLGLYDCFSERYGDEKKIQKKVCKS